MDSIPSSEATINPTFTTEQLRSVIIQQSDTPDITFLFDPDTEKLIFVGARACELLDPGVSFNKAKQALQRAGSDNGFRPGGVFNVDIRERRNNVTKNYEPGLLIENNNARGSAEHNDQLKTAVSQALDPDQFPLL